MRVCHARYGWVMRVAPQVKIGRDMKELRIPCELCGEDVKISDPLRYAKMIKEGVRPYCRKNGCFRYSKHVPSVEKSKKTKAYVATLKVEKHVGQPLEMVKVKRG